VYLEPSVVADQSQLAKFIQEKAHPGSGRADHFRQGRLIDRGIDGRWPSILAESKRRRRASRFSLELKSWSIKSSSTRLFRVNRYVTKSSENFGSLRSVASIAFLVMAVIRHSSIALAVPTRTA
jgi:hypothetical protein